MDFKLVMLKTSGIFLDTIQPSALTAHPPGPASLVKKVIKVKVVNLYSISLKTRL